MPSSVVRPSDLVTTFARPFSAAGVEWMIAGGVAAIVYGEPRLTQDLDIVAALEPRDAERFAMQFPSSEFYCPPVEVIAAEAERSAFGHFNLLHLESDARADIYLAGNDVLARRGLDARRLITLMGQEVPISSPEHVHSAQVTISTTGSGRTSSSRHPRYASCAW